MVLLVGCRESDMFDVKFVVPFILSMHTSELQAWIENPCPLNSYILHMHAHGTWYDIIVVISHYVPLRMLLAYWLDLVAVMADMTYLYGCGH